MSDRAMMSGRTGRPSRSEYLPCEPQSGESMAEREARRILAVADRESVAHNITGQGWACDPGTRVAIYSVRKALAESIAAFVAAEDPAAYLRAAENL